MERQFNKPNTKNPVSRAWQLRKRYSARKTFKRTLGAVVTPKNWLTRLLVQVGNTCTAYTAVAIKEATTPGIQFDPAKQWTEELAVSGTDGKDGVTADVMMQTGVKLGFFREGSASSSDQEKAWFTLTPTLNLDMFDQMKLALSTAPLAVSLNWYSDWDYAQGPVPHTFNSLLGGHETKAFENVICLPATKIVNVDGVDCIFLQGSWGPQYGNNGCFYFDRYMVNKCFFDVRYWASVEAADVVRLGFIEALLVQVVGLYHQLLRRKEGYPPSPLKPTPSVYGWNTIEAARHSVRLICDDMGLPYGQKDILCACIAVESGFNPEAIHFNKDSEGKVLSTDYGICQFNDGKNKKGVPFWIGEGATFSSSEEVLDNPEKCVRVMINEFKAGHENLWASFSTGMYKKYL